MANKKEQKLFDQFPPIPTQRWEEVINADLKGADYRKKLIWQTGEGFEVKPYYRAEDLQPIKYLASESGQFPYVRGTRKCNCWKIHQTVYVEDPKTANDTALKMIGSGVNSIGFNINDKEFNAVNLDTILSGISLNDTALSFCGCGATSVAELMLAKLDGMNVEKDKVRIAFVIDPIVSRLSLRGSFGCCEDGSKCFEKIAELVKAFEPYKHIRCTAVSGHQFHNSGSTVVQELAFALAAGHDYIVNLMQTGLTIDQAAHSVRFTMAVGANYFMEIAKFRAARMLWANIVNSYKPTCDCSEKMNIHAITSRWNITAYDPYVNMLRGTTEAMSAAIAGVQSLEVVPFDAAFRRPTDFSARIARNVQLLLKNESHFDQVVDPAGGSYYIEHLTQSIADQAWKLFRQVEEKGGYITAFKAGFIQETIETSAAKKDMNIATRRQTLLGTNQYPNFTEVADKDITQASVNTAAACCECDTKAEFKPLKPYRGSMAFEQLRLNVDRSDKEPKAFMLTTGSLAFARARSQFACNFFACAGIRVMDNTYFQSVEDGVKAALASKAEIVVLCASDDDYATLAPAAKALLGDKAIFVVAGAPASQPELEAQGIRNFISMKSNVLETLKFYLTELGI